MAIKGKGRSRSGRRVVAASPRPQLFVRKPPIWKRRWVRLTALAVIVVGAGAGLRLKMTADHRRDFNADQRAAVRGVSGQLFDAFPLDRSQIPPDVYEFFPALTADLDKLSKGTLSDSKARKEADQLVTAAAAAEQRIELVSLKPIRSDFTATTVKGATAKGLTVSQLTDAQFFMARAFGLYGQVGSLMKEAVAASGAHRKALVNQAKTLYSQAGQVFDRGYRMVLIIRESAGLPQFTFPTTGQPPGGTGG
jgi:hypothetical protein